MCSAAPAYTGHSTARHVGSAQRATWVGYAQTKPTCSASSTFVATAVKVPSSCSRRVRCSTCSRGAQHCMTRGIKAACPGADVLQLELKGAGREEVQERTQAKAPCSLRLIFWKATQSALVWAAAARQSCTADLACWQVHVERARSKAHPGKGALQLELHLEEAYKVRVLGAHRLRISRHRQLLPGDRALEVIFQRLQQRGS